MLLHLGFAGYRAVAIQDLKNARTLSRALEKCGYFEVLSDIHRLSGSEVGDVMQTADINEEDVEVSLSINFFAKPCTQLCQSYVPGLPVVAFRFSDQFCEKCPDIQQKWIQTLLRAKGWIVPNYELAPDLEKVEILRVVVRENTSETLIERLVNDIVSHHSQYPGHFLISFFF
jgi:glutamate decarboxylase